MNRAESLLITGALLQLATVASLAGESPYTGPGSKPGPVPTAPGKPLTYAYYCVARSVDTWYITNATSPEPQTGRYDPSYVQNASMAWTKYLDATLGPHKVLYPHCTDGVTSAAQAAWQAEAKTPGFAHIVKLDWRYEP
jgi:hypothetical protein